MKTKLPSEKQLWQEIQRNFTCPDWFKDAKFGIWAHWGPQAVPMVGDWYARKMYMQGDPKANHHRRVYGHPSKFGYKDIIDLWKAEDFDAGKLVKFYKECGAKYIFACAMHHDNFDCWDSKHHPWNSVLKGPKRDIMKEFAVATRAEGLRFGVAEHHARAWSWFNTNKHADTTGPMKGVPYDGNDPAFEDLYMPKHSEESAWYPTTATEAWQQNFLDRMLDLMDQHQPDLLYTDGGVPFGAYGLEMIAYFYRLSAQRSGKVDAVYAVKDPKNHDVPHLGEYRPGIGVLDVERGVVDGIQSEPWQTDTCIGDWYYKTEIQYQQPRELITMLIDIVSKNGNLLLNLPLRPEGTLDDETIWIADEIGRWLELNGDGIYGSRPWKQFAEGPTRLIAGSFGERNEINFTSRDFRFTTKGNTLNAFLLAWPQDGIVRIQSLSDGETFKKIRSVELVGYGPVSYEQQKGTGACEIRLPEKAPTTYANLLRLEGVLRD